MMTSRTGKERLAMKMKQMVVSALVASLALSSLPASAHQTAAVVDRAEVEQALLQRAQSEESARDSIRTLLAREDVKAMAGDMGLDLRQASNAVSSLQGEQLQRVADRAVAANEMMSGGVTIQISLVAILLIVIIIILLSN
jgi:hypothetical protein